MSESLDLRPNVEIPTDNPELHEAVIRDLIRDMGNDWTPYGIRMWIDQRYKQGVEQ
jgi:hypothetical protein